jgi:hypothetical protein
MSRFHIFTSHFTLLAFIRLRIGHYSAAQRQGKEHLTYARLYCLVEDDSLNEIVSSHLLNPATTNTPSTSWYLVSATMAETQGVDGTLMLRAIIWVDPRTSSIPKWTPING